MKNLIKHLIENNIDEILSKSIFNCHVKGLHSIMLLESPGKTIRMYVSVSGNDMYKNFPESMHNGMSLGFHPHHCNLTLHVIKGRILNWECVESETFDSICLDKYVYQSKIKEGDIAFKPIGKSYLKTKAMHAMYEGDSIHMKANDIHTVACERDLLTAWFVYEGAEDPAYTSLCWSNSNPNTQDFTGLYTKPTKDEILELLQKLQLI